MSDLEMALVTNVTLRTSRSGGPRTKTVEITPVFQDREAEAGWHPAC